MKHHLAELNVGRLIAPTDDPRVADSRVWSQFNSATSEQFIESGSGRMRIAALSACVFLSACVGSMSPPPVSKSPEAIGDYEVTGAVYRAEFFKGASYLEQERDETGRLKLVNGQPVPVELVFMDAAGVNPKIMVSRQDGTAMGVEDEATALKVAAILCADKARRPMDRSGLAKLPPPATTVLENGKWGVYNLCR